MKNYFLILLPVFVLFYSCQPNKIQEGKLEYTITYPNTEASPLMLVLLPETMTTTFKGTKMISTISRGGIFTTKIISDEADNSIEMRLIFGDKYYYTVLNENEKLELMASQPVYHIKSLNKTDSISNMLASSYSVTCKSDTIENSDAWFTEDLAAAHAYWFTSYSKIKGTPLIYDVERYGVLMHLEVVNFTEREVKEEEFNRDNSLTEIPFKQFEKEVQELFDTLLD